MRTETGTTKHSIVTFRGREGVGKMVDETKEGVNVKEKLIWAFMLRYIGGV